MTTSNNSDALNPLLLDAKKEYLTRLCEVLSPFIIEFLNKAYKHSSEESNSNKVLLGFQRSLKQVRLWNSTQVTEYTQRIESQYSFLGDLIAAVFVSYVKVLSSIRISTQRPNVKLRLPTNEAFIHKVYEVTARSFYENPFAIRDSQQRAKLVNASIEMAVRDMLPLKDVLQAYLATAVDDDQTFNPVLSPNTSPVKVQSPAASEHSFEEPDEEDEPEDYVDEEPKTIVYPSSTTQPTQPIQPIQPQAPPHQSHQSHQYPIQPLPVPALPQQPPQQPPPPQQQQPAGQHSFFEDAHDDEKHF